MHSSSRAAALRHHSLISKRTCRQLDTIILGRNLPRVLAARRTIYQPLLFQIHREVAKMQSQPFASNAPEGDGEFTLTNRLNESRSPYVREPSR